MKDEQLTTTPAVSDLFRTAIRRLARLRAQMRLGINVSRELSEIQGVLESLPLSTSEFGLAHNRLQNALKYLEAAEPGAARYELQLLETSLRLWSGALSEGLRPLRRSLKKR
jgi:hypothetical protein